MRERLRAILDVRTRRPQAIAEAATRRKRRAALLGDDNQLFIIAADHPARGALRVGERPMAMADRAELIDRLSLALGRPGVDGVLGTADIIEDLLLLGVLDDKVVIGSMNRGGLAGTVFESTTGSPGTTRRRSRGWGSTAARCSSGSTPKIPPPP